LPLQLKAAANVRAAVAQFDSALAIQLSLSRMAKENLWPGRFGKKIGINYCGHCSLITAEDKFGTVASRVRRRDEKLASLSKRR
jgi:hypothetical protein